MPPLRLPREWPYWAGGITIALVNTVLMLADGKPWGITSMLTNASARVAELVGMRPSTWGYFQSPHREQALSDFGWLDGSLWLNLGIVGGVLVSGLLSREFHIRKAPRPWRKVALAVGGGLLMGYGARLAHGCNAGILLGAIPSHSLQGWVFALVTFLGVLLGVRFFRRVL